MLLLLIYCLFQLALVIVVLPKEGHHDEHRGDLSLPDFPMPVNPQFIGCVSPALLRQRILEVENGSSGRGTGTVLGVDDRQECFQYCSSHVSPSTNMTYDHAYYQPRRGRCWCTDVYHTITADEVGGSEDVRVASCEKSSAYRGYYLAHQPFIFEHCSSHFPTSLGKQVNRDTWTLTTSLCLDFFHSDWSIGNTTIRGVAYRLFYEEVSRHWWFDCRCFEGGTLGYGRRTKGRGKGMCGRNAVYLYTREGVGDEDGCS